MVHAEMLLGKKPPDKSPPRKLPQENYPPEICPPPGKLHLENCTLKNCFARFLLLLTLSYGCSF